MTKFGITTTARDADASNYFDLVVRNTMLSEEVEKIENSIKEDIEVKLLTEALEARKAHLREVSSLEVVKTQQEDIQTQIKDLENKILKWMDAHGMTGYVTSDYEIYLEGKSHEIRTATTFDELYTSGSIDKVHMNALFSATLAKKVMDKKDVGLAVTKGLSGLKPHRPSALTKKIAREERGEKEPDDMSKGKGYGKGTTTNKMLIK